MDIETLDWKGQTSENRVPFLSMDPSSLWKQAPKKNQWGRDSMAESLDPRDPRFDWQQHWARRDSGWPINRLSSTVFCRDQEIPPVDLSGFSKCPMADLWTTSLENVSVGYSPIFGWCETLRHLPTPVYGNRDYIDCFLGIMRTDPWWEYLSNVAVSFSFFSALICFHNRYIKGRCHCLNQFLRVDTVTW